VPVEPLEQGQRAGARLEEDALVCGERKGERQVVYAQFVFGRVTHLADLRPHVVLLQEAWFEDELKKSTTYTFMRHRIRAGLINHCCHN
jgi:hypothetical protein